MKTAETLEPSVRGIEIDVTESLSDEPGLFLQYGSSDVDTRFLLGAIPLPDETICLFVTCATDASLTEAKVLQVSSVLLLQLA